MEWNYYTVSKDGKSLISEHGDIDFKSDVPRSPEEWETYLEENDFRGSVR